VSDVRLDPGDAELIVEARLGRRPQDMLEAAVVLEAWAGVPAQGALAAARALMPAEPAAPQPSVGVLPRPSSREGILVEGTAFIVTVLAIACWVAPLVTRLGAGVVERALFVALPLTLALQWGLRSRYLDHPHGLAQLADDRRRLLAVGVAVIGVPALALGLAGLVAGLLTVTWTGATILIRRRWPGIYVATILLGTPAMIAADLPLATLGAIAGVTTLAVALALRSSRGSARRPSGHWERAAVAGLIGTGLGLMLVLDRTVSWTAGAIPALALLPSTVASFWGGYHLRHLEQAIPGEVSGVPAAADGPVGIAWPALHVLIGGVARLVLLCAALSAALLALTPWLGSSARGIGILVGFGLFGLAAMLVSLLESMGRGNLALLAVACAVAVEAIVRAWGADPFSGTGLVVSGAVATVLVLPPVVALLNRPARTLATALWIP
jgi:hypothetical protein